MFQERPPHIHVGNHPRRPILPAIVQHDAHRPAVADQHLIHARPGDDLSTRGFQTGRQRLCDAAHPATGIAPGADIAIHIPHRVVEQHIGRPRRHRPQRGADDAAHRLIGLHCRAFEILVQKVRNRHRPEPHHVINLRLGLAGHLLAKPGQFHQIAGPERREVRRAAHQHRADQAAVAQDVAGVAVIAFGIAARMAGKLAPVCLVVAEHAKVAAVLGEQHPALVRQDLQPMLWQFQIAHDLGAKQAADIRAVGIGEAREQLAADRRPADPIVLLDHQNLQPRPREIARRHQPVVPGSDDQRVMGHSAALTPCSSTRSTAVSTAFSVSVRQDGSNPCASHMNHGSRLSGSTMMFRSCRW